LLRAGAFFTATFLSHDQGMPSGCKFTEYMFQHVAELARHALQAGS
jgi:hypothetical protein